MRIYYSLAKVPAGYVASAVTYLLGLVTGLIYVVETIPTHWLHEIAPAGTPIISQMI